MTLFDGMNAAAQGMSVFSYTSEIAAQNATMPYTKTGYVHQKVDVTVHPFTNAMLDATGTNEAAPGASPGDVQVAGTHGVKMGERDGAAAGVSEMLDATTGYDISEKTAAMFKAMAVATLDIGRGG